MSLVLVNIFLTLLTVCVMCKNQKLWYVCRTVKMFICVSYLLIRVRENVAICTLGQGNYHLHPKVKERQDITF